MKKAPSKEEVFGHRSLAYELLKAECAMKSISLNLSSLRFANHRKFKKETLKKLKGYIQKSGLYVNQLEMNFRSYSRGGKSTIHLGFIMLTEETQ